MRKLLAMMIFCISFAQAEQICVLDETHSEKSVFMCKDFEHGEVHYQEVLPILAHEAVVGLEEMGVKMVSAEEFVARVTPQDLIKLKQASPYSQDEVKPCFERVYYRVNEFNNLGDNHKTVRQLKKLANALQEAGVCDLPVKRQNFNSINIQSSQDVLHHFLCISNSESVFGTRNIGMGGRGPWGIHPAHNQRKGTRAFLDGKTRTLPYDGLCYPSKAIVRDGNGDEIKVSDRYLDDEVILDNAKCAMTLYKERGGFAPWGKSSSWGSNRHCSRSTRDRLQFFKHIGAAGCCTAACRQRHTDL